MADNRLGIRVETTADLAGVQGAKTALDDLSGRTVPQLTNSLKTLQAQAAGLTEALTRPFSPTVLKQFQAELDATNAKIAATKAELQSAAPVARDFGETTKRSLTDARLAAQALTSEIGVRMPRAITTMLARSETIGPILNAAFSAAAIGFAAEAILKLGEKMNAIYDDWNRPGVSLMDAYIGWKPEQLRDLEEQLDKMNKSFAKKHLDLTRQLALHGLDDIQVLEAEMGFKIEDVQNQFGGGKLQNEAAKLLIGQITELYAGKIQDIIDANIKAAGEAALKLQKEFAAQEEQLVRTATSGPGSVASLTPGKDTRGAAEVIKQEEERQRLLNQMREQGFESLQKYRDKEIKLDDQAAERHEQLTQRVFELDQQALDGRGNRTAFMLARITAEEQRQFDTLEKMYGKDADNYALLQQAKADLDAIAAQKRQQIIDQEADKWQSFYDRNIRSAKSFGDALKNIWNDIQSYFEKQVFRSVLGGLYGQGGGASGGSASGGGLLGGLLGGLFGGGPGGNAGSGMSGGFGSGIISNFLPTSGNGPLGIIGGGAGAATAQQAGMGNLATSMGLPPTTPLGNLLSKIGIGGSGGIGPGAALIGLGLGGSSHLGALGGGLLGAGLGIGALALGGAVLGTAGGIGAGAGALVGLGALGGRIGLAVVGIAAGLGALFGFMGQGKDKIHDTQIQQAGEQQMFKLLDDFNHQRVDYFTAAQGETKIYNDMIGQFQRSQSHLIPEMELNNILAQMAKTQDERLRRQQMLALMPVPEFDVGGAIPGAPGQPVPIVAHGGEFMMTAQAVNRIGMTVLQGLNTAGGGGAVAGPDTDTVTVEFSRSGFEDAVAMGILKILRKGGAASRALRG